MTALAVLVVLLAGGGAGVAAAHLSSRGRPVLTLLVLVAAVVLGGLACDALTGGAS